MSFRRATSPVADGSNSTRSCSTFGGNRVIPFETWEKLTVMAVLSEITELLKRWDVWRRVEEAPNRIDALEKRVAKLETLLLRSPGEACPKCGTRHFRVEEATPIRTSQNWAAESII
jgi:hypothetical protein